jgi:hypothetical protein
MYIKPSTKVVMFANGQATYGVVKSCRLSSFPGVMPHHQYYIECTVLCHDDVIRVYPMEDVYPVCGCGRHPIFTYHERGRLCDYCQSEPIGYPARINYNNDEEEYYGVITSIDADEMGQYPDLYYIMCDDGKERASFYDDMHIYVDWSIEIELLTTCVCGTEHVVGKPCDWCSPR